MRFINLGLRFRQTALQQLPDFCGRSQKAAKGLYIAALAATTTLGHVVAVKPQNPPANGRSILRTFFPNLPADWYSLVD